MNIPEHGEIFERHLGGPVLSNGYTAMGADDIDVGLGDDAHPEVVKGSRQKGRKGRDKGHATVAASHADGHAHQVLLADEAFHVAFGEHLAYFLLNATKRNVKSPNSTHDCFNAFCCRHWTIYEFCQKSAFLAAQNFRLSSKCHSAHYL